MKRVILLSLSIILAACNSTSVPPAPDDPFYAPILPEPKGDQVVNSGSLYITNYSNNLYSDARAHRVGDIITVMLKESTQASKSANTELTKDSSYTLAPVIGPDGGATFNGNPFQVTTDSASEFTGDSKADQSNSLNGQISVNVLRVLSNGNLIIRGEKWLTLNNGKEYVRLTGLVRPQDIAYDNTVDSFKVANARIEYSGTGAHKDTQMPGWLTKVFNSVFWPF